MENVNISMPKKAYKKAYLHACKYVSEDVIGILVGKIGGSNYKVEDAFPLFHTRILQCPLEVALDLVQA